MTCLSLCFIQATFLSFMALDRKKAKCDDTSGHTIPFPPRCHSGASSPLSPYIFLSGFLPKRFSQWKSRYCRSRHGRNNLLHSLIIPCHAHHTPRKEKWKRSEVKYSRCSTPVTTTWFLGGIRGETTFFRLTWRPHEVNAQNCRKKSQNGKAKAQYTVVW